MATPFHRHIGQMNYPGAAGQETRLELPRTALHRRLYLQLFGAVTVATGGGTLLSEGIHGILRSIEIRANGAVTLKRFDGGSLRQLNLFDYGQLSVLDDVATTTGPVNANWTIPFSMPRAIRPIDTILDARRFTTLELYVTWGNEADCFASPTGTYTLTDLRLSVGIDEILGVEAREGFGLYMETSQLQQYSSASGLQEIRLPAADHYRALTIKSHTANVPGTPVDTVVDLVSLRSGQTYFVQNAGWGDDDAATQFRGTLNGMNTHEYGIDVPVGYRRLEFGTDGMLGHAINADALEELVLELDLGTASVTGDVRVYRHVIRNPRRA